jgi:hypothetical protein
MTPGQMELMRIPSLPYPAASVLESPSTPALAAAYYQCPCQPVSYKDSERTVMLRTYRSIRSITHTSENRGDVHNASPLRRCSSPIHAPSQWGGHSPRTSTSPSKKHILHLQICLLLQHLRNLRPLAQPHTPQVNPLDPIPRCHGQLMTPRPRRARDSRIVDTVVDSAERFDAFIHHALDVRLD